jgi:nuclease S1
MPSNRPWIAWLAGMGWCVGLGSSSHVSAWGPEGHQIVAEIAERHLTPEAKTGVSRLLESNLSLADVASYADGYRERCANTGPWHYVNIPLAASVYDEALHCPQPRGCVISALSRQIAILKDRQALPDERAFALRLIVHLIADLHQPLHSGDAGDRGGNLRRVRWAGRETSLHGLWDFDLIHDAGRTQESYVRMLLGSALRADKRAIMQGDPRIWALQAHDVAQRFAYGKLPPGPVSAVAELGEAYARAVQGALDTQLLRAGLRLAMVLNDALAKPGPKASAELLAQNRICEPSAPPR